jgi:hypothetical protein
MKLRPGNNYQRHELNRAITFLKLARDAAKDAGCPSLLKKIRSGLKSADGARRHFDRRLMHWTPSAL